MATWLGTYRAYTFGVRAGDNATVRLNPKNRPQPDLLLIIRPECGGATTITDDYVTGPPEHVDEISASSVSYDLHTKLHEYHLADVPEYVVWRVWDRAIDWFVRNDQGYDKIEPESGVYRSLIFPGLWLDAHAMIAGDRARVLQVLQLGIATPERAAFCEGLRRKAGASGYSGKSTGAPSLRTTKRCISPSGMSPGNMRTVASAVQAKNLGRPTTWQQKSQSPLCVRKIARRAQVFARRHCSLGGFAQV